MGSSRLKSRRRQDLGSKWARVAIAILSTVGVIDTGSITLNKWGLIGNLNCLGGLEGCDKVLNSPWGNIIQTNTYSIPLSLVGLISYFLIVLMANDYYFFFWYIFTSDKKNSFPCSKSKRRMSKIISWEHHVREYFPV